MSKRLSYMFGALCAAALIVGASALAFAQPVTAPAPSGPPAATRIDANGTVHVQGFDLPPSAYLSPEAVAAMPRTPTDMEAQMRQMLAAGQIQAIRPRIGELMAPQIARFTARYSVTRTPLTIAGVQAVSVKPTAPIPAANRNKVLLNLPGGGFVMGMAPGTGMVESIPVAALANVEVISITYRQFPEFKYPAASDDVVAVYRELLKTHRPQDIGIFGCSAGGILTAEAIARFEHDHIPLPRAIGIHCASADARFNGDSRYYSVPFQGLTPAPRALGYFEGADMSDPLVSPIVSPEVLSHFPPTLIITSTRAGDLSSAVNTHRELVKAGVDAELHVWDGFGHAFFYNIDLPESREAYQVIANFFIGHMGLARPAH